MYAIVRGVTDLLQRNALTDFTLRNKSLKWLAIVWGLMEIMPGLVFFGYVVFHLTAAVMWCAGLLIFSTASTSLCERPKAYVSLMLVHA